MEQQRTQGKVVGKDKKGGETKERGSTRRWVIEGQDEWEREMRHDSSQDVRLKGNWMV